MKTKELKEMNNKELIKLIDEQRAIGLELRFNIASKQTKNHRKYRIIKKHIARALTILKERTANNKQKIKI